MVITWPCGIARKVLLDRVRERDLSVLDKQDYRSRRELLGDRPEPEDGVGLQRHAEFHARHADGLAVEHLAVLDHQDRPARLIGREGGSDDGIHLRGGLRGRRCRGQRDQQGRERASSGQGVQQSSHRVSRTMPTDVAGRAARSTYVDRRALVQ
jgi:hypothetical protein